MGFRLLWRASLFWALLICALTAARPARAASLDPNLKWHTAQTEHFIVYWYDGEELVADRYLHLIEGVYDKVTKAVDFVPPGKTHLVLTDVTDGANGFALTIPYDTIRLYITAPQEGSSLDNYDEWLTMLVTHEFTHICHINKIGGIPLGMRKVFGTVVAPNQILPRWVIEGYATYQETALTEGGRGRSAFADMIVRSAVMGDDWPPIDRLGGDTESWPGGYLPYIFGVEFLQYLRATYGDDKVTLFTRMTGHEPFPFFPFWPRLNHDAKRCFGKSFRSLWADYHASLLAQYTAQKDALGPLTPIEQLTHFGANTNAPRLSPDGKTIVFSVANGKGPASIRTMDVDGKNAKVLIPKFTADGFGWTPDSKVVAFGSEKLWENYYVWSDVYSWDLEGSRLTRLTLGARARQPDYKPDGTELTFVTNDVSNNDLTTTKIDQSLVWKTNNKDWTEYSTPRWRPDGKALAVSIWQTGGFRDVVLVDPDGKLIQRITADRFIDRDPTWTADGKYLLFSSDRSGIPDIYAWESATGRYFQVTNVLGGAFQPSVTPDETWIVFQGYTSKGYDVFRTKFDTSTWKELGWTFDPEIYDATCKPRAENDGGEESASGSPLPPGGGQGEGVLATPSLDATVADDAPSIAAASTLDDQTAPPPSYDDPTRVENDLLPAFGHAFDADERVQRVEPTFGLGPGTGLARGWRYSSLLPLPGERQFAVDDEPAPDSRTASEKITKGGHRPTARPDKNAGVDMSPYKPKSFHPWKTLAPRYWLPAQVWITESGAYLGAVTGATDPLFRHSWSAWVNYNTNAAFVGGGFRYFNDRWKPTLYVGGDRYVLDYGQSVYQYPDVGEPGSHILNIHSTGQHYFEQHMSGQFGAFWLWRSRYFMSAQYLFDRRTSWTSLSPLTYGPFLPVTGDFAGPSVALTLDRSEYYRWSISPQRGYTVTLTGTAWEPLFAGDPQQKRDTFRKEIGTVDGRAYFHVPYLPWTVLALRGVAGGAQGDAIRPSTFRVGGALGESVFTITTPNYYSLRGYPFFAFGGERLLLGSAELRFPIWRANRGLGTGPVYLRTMHGAFYADSGQVWGVNDNPTANGFHTGVGGEVRMDTVWYYYFPLTIRLGYAFALNNDPAGYKPGDPYGLVFTLGTSF